MTKQKRRKWRKGELWEKNDLALEAIQEAIEPIGGTLINHDSSFWTMFLHSKDEDKPNPRLSQSGIICELYPDEVQLKLSFIIFSHSFAEARPGFSRMILMADWLAEEGFTEENQPNHEKDNPILNLYCWSKELPYDEIQPTLTRVIDKLHEA